MHPVKAVGPNLKPLGRDTRVVPSNIVLDGSQSPREGVICGSEPQFAAYRLSPNYFSPCFNFARNRPVVIVIVLLLAAVGAYLVPSCAVLLTFSTPVIVMF